MTERPTATDEERAQAWLAVARGDPVSADVAVQLQPSGVMGTLEQMALTEIIQMLDFGKKTARVDVYLADTVGAVHVHDGLIVRVTATTSTRDVFGEPAFLALCRDHHGFFRIQYGREEVERNVTRPTTFVLLEALRTIDEAGNASAPADPFADAFAAEEPAPPVLDAPAVPVEQLQQEPRYACALDVDVAGIAHVIEDIGNGGAFIASHAPRDVGATLHLTIAADSAGTAPLELLATVVHSHARGMGVRFDDTAMSDETQHRLRALVASVAAQASVAPSPAELRPELVLPASSTLDSLADIDFLIATGDLKAAQTALVQAQATAPNDDDLRRRLADVNTQIDAALAVGSLQHAERTVGKPEALAHARRAVRLRPSREVLLRALAVFAHARSHEDVADAAQGLMNLDADDEGAIRTWIDANIELQRWTVALRTAEALLRRHPSDEQLRSLVQRLAQRARGHG